MAQSADGTIFSADGDCTEQNPDGLTVKTGELLSELFLIDRNGKDVLGYREIPLDAWGQFQTNIFDTMGQAGAKGLFNAIHRQDAGWFDPQHLLVTSTPGVYFLELFLFYLWVCLLGDIS